MLDASAAPSDARTDVVWATMDGNEAAAHVAYRLNEVCAIYPITPSSTMAELCDQWASEGRPNLWGGVPLVAQLQSEGGAAGALHGALQGGALSATFTASQGLMLMIPNMYRIAGELTPTVFHVTARTLATHALSIFGDHADVMAVRGTGFAMLSAASVQEAHDMALVAQAATLESRVPFIQFFDGFRTSHEVSKLALIPDAVLRAMIDDDLVLAHRARALNPDAPVIRGTAQNPDVFFQAREACNVFHQRVPGVVEAAMETFAGMTGRAYRLFDYRGAPDAETVMVIMGSGADAACETADHLNAQGAKLGVLNVRLYRPFSAEHFLAALPPTTRAIVAMDRCKEPGAPGEPLFMDVSTALYEAAGRGTLPMAAPPRVIGGRYGLSSKEFTPAMVKAAFDEAARPAPRSRFTVGIEDDVTHLSLTVDPDFDIEPDDVIRAMFFGLGADGTVGANKNTIKIIGAMPEFFAQGYFVYDSKKSGSQTVSHVRFGRAPIRSSYLIRKANFIGVHQWSFVPRVDFLSAAAPGATVLIDCPLPPEKVWDALPRPVQARLIELGAKLHVIDAATVAREAGMGRRTNTIMQTCFFAISGVMERDRAIAAIKKSIEKTYAKKGAEVVAKNFAAVDATLAHLSEIPIPKAATSAAERPPVVSPAAPAFVRDVTAAMMAGLGDALPVSALPADGTFPTGTTKWEKRNVSDVIPIWDPETCIQCGNCSFVCPHSVIRARLYDKSRLEGAPEGFRSAPIDARGFPDTRYTLQVYAEDCTGCGLCVEACPAKNREAAGRKAINLDWKAPVLEAERENIRFFETLPVNERRHVDFSTVRGVQFLQPLFEFPGACAGCGETPYLKAISQLFGDRLMVANATGCSSIYGGNLPTTPWTVNAEGRGPAWANSLFEDNAEFGLGMRLADDHAVAEAHRLLIALAPQIGHDLVGDLIEAEQKTETQIAAQRQRVAALLEKLAGMEGDAARHLRTLAERLVRRSVWIVGGDGWAYDIGSAGVDHVLASGRNVNILIMDTEVYSNTGGQASKSTPIGAVAKFANGGKQVAKKDLAMQAISYGNVYVARVAFGANPQQALLAMREAEAYEGTSIILAYSHCIAHGIDMKKGLDQQSRAVQSGYWPLMRFNPAIRDGDGNPFSLDCPRPSIRLSAFTENELRYRMLRMTNPRDADALMAQAQAAVDARWKVYEEMAAQGVGEAAVAVGG